MLRTLIVYACPVGPLADQIVNYWEQVKETYGPNSAHSYMPHCSLTGFFHDEVTAIPTYLSTLETVLTAALPDKPDPVIEISALDIQPDFHSLVLTSHWLKDLLQAFADKAHSDTRQEELRLKDWLHVSLAYEFDPAHADPLAVLTQQSIDPQAPVQWELRLYERDRDHNWICHGNWSL